MSLVEYKSPVLKKPKFGWQRYQFGNKSAAELKLSLWDANLSEVVVKNGGTLGSFPLVNDITIALDHTAVPTATSEARYSAMMNLLAPINNVNELVQFLNKRVPYLGEFRPDNQNVLLVVDSTWARTTQDDETGNWKFAITAS
jgi:uncharacterized protein YfdQ (DUF2303 family)